METHIWVVNYTFWVRLPVITKNDNAEKDDMGTQILLVPSNLEVAKDIVDSDIECGGSQDKTQSPWAL